MFSTTHKIISNQVYLNIRDNLNYKLNKDILSWGAIRPDIVPSLLAKKHYQEESLDYVINRILALMNLQTVFIQNIDINKYLSLNLGEIIHFLSDFACLPHSQRWEFKVAMIPHLKYETKLNHIALIHTPEKPLYLPEAKANDFFGIKALIIEILEGHKAREDYINDLKYSALLSSCIASIILKENQKLLLNAY